MLALVVPVGLLIGLSLGALGGGGSILAVPALVYIFGQDSRAATTGSLLIVGVTSLIGLIPHRRAGRVSLAKGLVFGVLGVAGSYAGSRLSTAVPEAVLLAGFSVLMLIVAVLMTRRRRKQARSGAADGAVSLASDEPVLRWRPTFACDCPRVARIVLTATGVGLLTGFFGVGGGFAVVPALVLALGLSMPLAVGTSLLVIAINSFTALFFRAGQDVTLDWSVIGGFTLAAVAGSLLGSRVVSRVSPARLSLAFTVLLVVVALYTATRSFPLVL
ncbi:sulfite exporter TauE/SafE family protein [Pengzhenrongella phosphoraccumulans]|uniref:sulfite exporter TauE/SafE family protein n=1 Tax=Pengzhenrongella phosphoraccumulans TaxID=3114394 RepID=UPI00388E3D51